MKSSLTLWHSPIQNETVFFNTTVWNKVNQSVYYVILHTILWNSVKFGWPNMTVWNKVKSSWHYGILWYNNNYNSYIVWYEMSWHEFSKKWNHMTSWTITWNKDAILKNGHDMYLWIARHNNTRCILLAIMRQTSGTLSTWLSSVRDHPSQHQEHWK